jgi:hypothetical protein
VSVQKTLSTRADFRRRLEAGTFDDVFGDRHVGNRSRTASRELALHVANHFGIDAEAFQERANLLDFVKRANACYALVIGVVGHERNPKRRANATD